MGTKIRYPMLAIFSIFACHYATTPPLFSCIVSNGGTALQMQYKYTPSTNSISFVNNQ